MIKEEMDFEWHLISFCHGGAARKQVAELSRFEKVRESQRRSAWKTKSHIKAV